MPTADKIYDTLMEIHGGVQRLEERLDNAIDRQADQDTALSTLSGRVSVLEKAHERIKTLWGVVTTLAAGVGAAAVMAWEWVSGRAT